jgi:hypothetical protein
MIPKDILRSFEFSILKRAEKGIAYFLWGGVLQANVAVAGDGVYENQAAGVAVEHSSCFAERNGNTSAHDRDQTPMPILYNC